MAAELEELDAGSVRAGRGGVHFQGDSLLSEKCCLWLRSATRVREQLAQTEIGDRDELYAWISSIDWTSFLRVEQTLAVHAAIRDSFATDPRFPALVVKDAIVDQFRARRGRRPSVDRRTPDLPLELVLRGRRAILYRDLSGESLHKRGHRPVQVKSPINEALAAGLLRLTEWDRRTPLIDPMCGSATFLVEAALWAGDVAPGLRRSFAFEQWPDHDAHRFASLREEARRRARRGRESIPPLHGSDRHGGALGLARSAVAAAGVGDAVELRQIDVGDRPGIAAGETVVVNPPYGERLGEGDELYESWRALGRFLHAGADGAVAFVLSGNPELTRLLGLRASRKWPVRNGPLDCRWLRYEIGSSRPRESQRDPPAVP